MKDDSKTFLKVDRIYTELNLLDSYDIDFIDAYFNRDRINRKVSLYDGYLGCRIRSGHNELLKKDNINMLPSDIELYQKDDLYIGNDDLGEKKVIN